MHVTSVVNIVYLMAGSFRIQYHTHIPSNVKTKYFMAVAEDVAVARQQGSKAASWLKKVARQQGGKLASFFTSHIDPKQSCGEKCGSSFTSQNKVAAAGGKGLNSRLAKKCVSARWFHSCGI